jgi:hydroxymethylbilane synthase
LLPSPLILVTRRSPLALQQASWVKAELMQKLPGCNVQFLALGTSGDRMRDQPLPEIGGKGLFTKELEEALQDGRAHLAVHSLKDLPTQIAPGLTVAAVPRREDARDVLISREGKQLADLPRGARIGTSSVRRAAQLRCLRPDLQVEPLRGNLETRLRKLRAGSLDAIVIAAAGMHRMDWANQITEYLPETVVCPAVGQGALGIESRADDAPTLAALAVLEDPETRLYVTAERALLSRLGGGCQVPIAAHTRRDGNAIRLTAVVIRPDGSGRISATSRSGVEGLPAAESLGNEVAEDLLRQGALSILDSAESPPGTLPIPDSP